MITVKTTVIKPMNCGFASEGILRIDNIASGVGIIMFNAASRQAAGIHTLRGEAPGITPKNPAYYADTGIAFILEHFKTQSPAGPTCWRFQKIRRSDPKSLPP